VTHLFQKNHATRIRTVVDRENGVSILKSGRDTLWRRLSYEGSIVTVVKGKPGADAAMNQALVILFRAQIYMREREYRHECEKGVLKTSGPLQHR
jgi:hypothetical protein